MTVPVTLLEFTGESVMAPVPAAVTPEVISALEVEVQEKVVPAIELVGVKFNAALLQISFCNCVAVFVISGAGFTVTVTSSVAPAQPLAEGVMR